MKIGVFDSGIGGKSIAQQLAVDFPASEIVYADDHVHVPYGSRTQEEVKYLTDAAIQPLLNAECAIIVIACNTATAAAIEHLREKYPDTPFVGLEPMVKPAVSLTRSNKVAVCATPSTLSSERYMRLKERYAQEVAIFEPDCSMWATMIEHNNIDTANISAVIEEVCSAGADVIVLACTHYHWIKEEIAQRTSGKALVIDPSESISKRVGTMLYELGLA